MDVLVRVIVFDDAAQPTCTRDLQDYTTLCWTPRYANSGVPFYGYWSIGQTHLDFPLQGALVIWEVGRLWRPFVIGFVHASIQGNTIPR